jgi:hypothetical protein
MTRTEAEHSEAACEIDRLAMRIEKLEAALRPFAHVARGLKGRMQNERLAVDRCNNSIGGGHDLTVGDFHDALAALTG